MSKSDARDWHEQQRINKQLEEKLSQEEINLWYAANKKDRNLPDPEFFSSIGRNDVATLIKSAYNMMSEAFYLYESRKNSE